MMIRLEGVGRSIQKLPWTWQVISSFVGKIDAMVIAYEAGSDVAVTSTYVDTTDGSYVLIPLVEGTYDLEAVATGYDSGSETGVGVTAQYDNSGHDFVLTPTGGGF